MLRESSLTFGYDVDIAAIADTTIPVGVSGGNALLQFVDAVLGVSGEAIDTAQTRVLAELGADALVDAAGVFGNFQMMNRIAEGSGIPVPGAAVERERDIVEALGLERFVKH